MFYKGLSPLTLSTLYAILASLWLTFSDYIVFTFVKGNWIEVFEYLTNFLFVIISAWLLFFVIRENNRTVKANTLKYQDLFENNPQPMWIYDQETLQFLAVNNAAIAHYGFSAEEFSRMTKRDIRLEEDLPTFLEDLKQVKKSLKEVRLTRHKKKDGSIIHVELTSRALLYEGKQAVLVLSKDVTTHVNTLNRLKQQEEVLHNIFTKTPTGICITNEEGVFEQVNDAYCQIYSYTPDELLGKHFTVVVPPTEKSFMEQLHTNFINGQEELRGEWQVINKKGESLYIMADAVLINDMANRKHKATFVTDITRQKKDEASLATTLAELQNYKLALDKSALVSVTNLQGTIVYVNDIFCKTAKYSAEELIGQNHRIINSGYHDKAFWVNLWQTISSKKLWRGEIRNRAKDGSYYWVDTIINPVFDEKGKLSQYLSIRYEITDRKNTEERIKASEKALKEAQEIAHIGNWELNVKENKVTWSDEIFRILGYSKEKGSPTMEELQSLVHPEDAAHYQETVEKALIQGISYNIDLRIRSAKDEQNYTYINLIGNPAFNEKGEIIKISGTSMDINQRKLAEKNLQEQNQELLKINAELDRFVYSAGHDLRAPLVSVLGLINIAQMDPAPAKKDEYMSLMRRSIHKLDNFIRDIINFSRNTRTEITSEKIDFQAMIQDILDSLSYLKGMEAFDTKIQITEESPFYSDAKRLSVVFNNLLSNAIRYSDPYKLQSFVHIQIVTSPQQALITISDNGIGIEPEHIDKIFNMFYRATESKSGSGLGLYILKETLQTLKGSIQVSSQVGKGTTFTVSIPNTLHHGAGEFI